MRSSRAIERYDRMMLADLGSHPVYQWKWSEDLIHVMDEVNPTDGKPILTPVPCGSIYAVQQQKTTRRWPGIWHQWVICALIELNADDGAVHGTGIAAWVPVYDRRSRPVCLPENQMPNQAATESFIQQVRKMRTRDAEELGQFEDMHKPATVPMDESERNTQLISRAEKKKFDIYKDAMKDGFTAFGEEPGKKGSTMFPRTAKEMAADFNAYRGDLKMPELAEKVDPAEIAKLSGLGSDTPDTIQR